ncbi:MAG TPA: low affinity iron permease family protein [Phenylobacterium sp.]|nr:low affinity iron permease family protein [Phenylobacterium sp.]
MSLTKLFSDFASHVSRFTGRPLTFVTCIALVAIWAASGPMFGFSDTWQLIINTSTTIITFLMVFLIQNTQNRDNAALQAKLDELIRVTNAHNRYIGVEKLTDKELEKLLDDMETAAKKDHDPEDAAEVSRAARSKAASAAAKSKTSTPRARKKAASDGAARRSAPRRERRGAG